MEKKERNESKYDNDSSALEHPTTHSGILITVLYSLRFYYSFILAYLSVPSLNYLLLPC